MRCREQPERWDDSGRDTKGCSSERHIYFWNLIKKLIHSSGNFYKSGSGEQPFVKQKWNRASLTVEASLALPVFLIAVLVLLKIVDLYRLHGMLTVSLQESARYLSVCAYAVDETGKETYEIPETAACIAYAEAKIPKEIRENGTVTLARKWETASFRCGTGELRRVRKCICSAERQKRRRTRKRAKQNRWCG